MSVWLYQHGRSFAAAFARHARMPLGSTFNVLVIAIAMSLPAGLYVVTENLRNSSQQLAPEPQLSVFLALDASRAEVAQIDARLRQNPRVERYKFVGRDQALQELRQSSGLADVVDSMPQNPLPDAFIINARNAGPQALDALQEEIMQWPRVAHVQLDAAWARRLDAALRFGRFATAALAAMLALALLAVMFNTIRLQVLTQRDEIEVLKLIGATDGYIQRPFLYYGTLQGFAGGAGAWIIVSAGVWFVNHNLGELSHLYASLFQLNSLSLRAGMALVLAPAALGMTGAWLSVSRHLAAIESERRK